MVGRDSDDYYGSYAPARRHQLTLRLACLPGEARQRRAGSHVHCRSLGGVGVQLFPCGPGVAITRPLATHPETLRHDQRPGPGSPIPRVPAHRWPGPYPSGLSRGLRLRGFDHWFTFVTHCPPCLPRPRGPIVPARRVVVRAACRLSPQLRGQAALSFTGLPRQPGGGVSHPTRTGSASWRTRSSKHSAPASCASAIATVTSPGESPRRRALTGATRAAAESSASINSLTRRLRPSSPEIASPAYGVSDGSSARNSIRPGPLPGLTAITLWVRSTHTSSAASSSATLGLSPDGNPRERGGFRYQPTGTNTHLPVPASIDTRPYSPI